MALNKIKPVIEEIDGVRCVIVENECTASRTSFLTQLLTQNGYEVKVATTDAETKTVGVTNLLFNPVLDVYKRRLKTVEGKRVTPEYWLTGNESNLERTITYWK